ncbi:MAG: DNA-binding protein [Clostridia bacterium]|nr:DNA-binding protein [Clostridia bacterium]
MEKDFEYVELFEIYKDLLTDKQRELFSSYYLFDLSLSEIADVEGGSRQSVYDAVKKVKIKLSEYEKILGVQEKTKRLEEVASLTKDENTARAIREIIER